MYFMVWIYFLRRHSLMLGFLHSSPFLSVSIIGCFCNPWIQTNFLKSRMWCYTNKILISLFASLVNFSFVLSHSWQQNLLSGHSIGWHVPHVHLKCIYTGITFSLSYWERGFCLRDEMQSLKNIECSELQEILTVYLLRHVTDRGKSEKLSSLVIMVDFDLSKHWYSPCHYIFDHSKPPPPFSTFV